MTKTKPICVDLLLLITVVLLINIPFLANRSLPQHDTKYVLGIFDYFYSNVLHAHEMPHWMCYGLYGLDAAACHATFMTGASYLALFFGKCLGIADSLSLFEISLCMEQLLFLLGLYLLSKSLFKERAAVFCVCLTSICTLYLHSQIFFNFRMYYLLPLEFFFLIRLRKGDSGFYGWLAGIVALLGPLGNAPYVYPFWAFVLTLFSIGLFWDRPGAFGSMFRRSWPNVCAAFFFIALLVSFILTLRRALDNVEFLSPLRTAGSGKVLLHVFLTYGGHDLGEFFKELFLPSANIRSGDSRNIGMNAYIGVMGIFFAPLALRNLTCPKTRTFVITALALFLLSRGGIFARLIYYFPGMSLFRHVGFVTTTLKMMILILAGFGLDLFIRNIREGTLIKKPGLHLLLLAFLGAAIYVDLYHGEAYASLIGALKSTFALKVALKCPILRGISLAALALAVWRACRVPPQPGGGRANSVIYCLVACIVLDCVLYQFEFFSNSPTSKTQLEYPALKLNYNEIRSDEISDRQRDKYKIWTSERADPERLTEYQMGFSSTLQWDSPQPRYRLDWFPKNVFKMQKVFAHESDDFRTICGIGSPRLRILYQAQYVATDQEARTLLKNQTGWDKKLILTGSNPDNKPVVTTTADSSSDTMTVTDFSANAVSVQVEHGSSQPAWLVYADAYTPGWHAEINGRSAPVLKAYSAFKAVPLLPGKNQIKLFYHNGLQSVGLSVFTAMAGLSAAVALLFLFGLALKEAFAGVGPAEKI